MTELFISDLHLDEKRPDITEGFIQFLATEASKASALYILGDFFEVWLGDDHDTPFNQQVISELAKLDNPIYIMHGNRDFLIGHDFCKAIGATLLPDPSVIELNGQPVLLMHGDSLCTQDEKYMEVRKLLRNEMFQQDFLTKSIPERQAFADQARGESQSHTRETAMDIMDVTDTEVVRVMQEAGVSTLIHGHTHRPDRHKVALANQTTGERIVLGDWDSHGWCLRVKPDGFELEQFPLS